MKATITSVLPASADQVWALVRQSRTLVFITRGLLRFGGVEQFPAEWQPGATVQTRLFFFGVLPAWRHSLTVEWVDFDKRVAVTQERGGLIKVWNHRISAQPVSTSACQYTDEIDIQAGLFTPCVWLFAQIFYRYRHWRWRQWLKLNAISESC